MIGIFDNGVQFFEMLRGFKIIVSLSYYYLLGYVYIGYINLGWIFIL